MTAYPKQDPTHHYDDPYTGPNPWIIRLPVLTFVGLLLLVVLLGIIIGAFRNDTAGEITPGVSVLGLDVGGMTRDEAITALDARFTYPQDATFTFTYAAAPELDAVFAAEPDRLQRTAAQLGVSFDVEATVDNALAVAAEEDLFSALREQALTWFNGEAVAPVVIYDQESALVYLNELAALIYKEPTPYNARLQGDEVVLGESGRALDVMATFGALNAALTGLSDGGEIPLAVYEIAPPTTVANAADAATATVIALSGPVILTAEDAVTGAALGPWTISVEQIEALLTTELVEGADGNSRYEVQVDVSAFREALQELAPGLRARPADGRFHFDPATRELVTIKPAVNGRELDVDESLVRIEQAILRAENRTVPLAFDFVLPRYHNNITAAELGITELVTESTTYYTGSETNRRHNIAEGASRFDGIIIGPGEEFSFNYWLGELSAETGFVEGKVIVGGRTVGGIGGGICQVSTTAFRAAFEGGFMIIERNSHAYRVGYYELDGAPPGLDAAIWTPERDFRFQNDTPYHLLIETSVYPAQDALQFRFYSTNPGRVVEIQQPSVRNVEPSPAPGFEANNDLAPGQVLQVDYAAEGADVNVTRVIRDMQGNVMSEDNIFTHYLPWQAVFQVHPSDARLQS